MTERTLSLCDSRSVARLGDARQSCRWILFRLCYLVSKLEETSCRLVKDTVLKGFVFKTATTAMRAREVAVRASVAALW